MIVTTAGRTNEDMIALAKKVANDLSIPYVSRNKKSIIHIQENLNEDVIVVGKNRIEIFPLNSVEPLFFHPNSAMFRMKRLMAGDDDPFINTCDIHEGDSLLDCTLGLGSDSIVASFVTGQAGKVTAMEGNKFLFYLLKVGLPTWESGHDRINFAMKQIEVVHDSYENFLKKCPSKSYDVVYFDPMFEETIEESTGIKGIKQLAIYSKLSNDTIEEAKRVARKRVVLKDHWRSPHFERLGFTQIKRKTAKFHFGVIEV